MSETRLPVVVGVADKQPTAVRYAVAEAGRLQRPLRVVHSWSLPAASAEFYIGADMVDSLRIAGESVLADARQVVGDTSSEVDATYVIATGSPINVLSDEAELAATLILGSDDVPWFDRLLGGEISGHLARNVACPTVVVPEREVPGGATRGVVVTLDGDTSAAGPLRYAFEQADARDEPLHILHVAPVGTLRADFDSHRANTAEVVAGWQEQFPQVVIHRETVQGRPSQECIEATAAASLVVIGRHHGSSVPFAQARPIALTVLRNAQCPVAVVPLDYGRG